MANTNYKRGDDLDFVFLSRDHVVAPSDKLIYVVGSGGGTGNLGLGDPNDQITTYTQLGTRSWSSLAVGRSNHMGAVAADGSLWMWGYNVSGQLGTGNRFDSSIPSRVGTLTNWSKVAIGNQRTLALKTDGTLWAWGMAGYQLGVTNTTTNYSSPIQVGSLNTWSKLACGSNHTLAIQTDGTLWGWGLNTYGENGSSNYSAAASPVQIGQLTDWTEVACGSGHSLAIRSNGTLWAWGYNVNGQLGVGDTTNYNSPVQVGSGITDWTKVVAGQYFSYALRSNGLGYAWGANSVGQLGLGNTLNYSTPVMTGGYWSSVATGNEHMVGIKSNGTLWAWGYGTYAGLTSLASSPVQVGTDNTWIAASGAMYMTAALKYPTV